MSRALALCALGALAGCASVDADPNEVPLCGPVASLHPLPDAGSCGAELAGYEAAVADRVIPRMSGALIRVAFDGAARAQAACVEAANPSDAWLARRHLAAQPHALAELPPGPACLSERRLDLNRYEAALADLDYAGGLCTGEGRAFAECIEQKGHWIVRDRPGWTRPFLFVAPEVSDPPDLDASDTVSRCWRKTGHHFEKQSACIQRDGWEMLAPPPR